MRVQKTVSLAVTSWLGVTFLLGCWYVFVGWRYMTIDASYETPSGLSCRVLQHKRASHLGHNINCKPFSDRSCWRQQ
jgi:hypothetical protein